MAFITLEDLMGSVEVIIFPKDYEANRELFVEAQSDGEHHGARD